MRRKRVTITLRQDVLDKVDTLVDGQKIRNRSNAIETIILEKFKGHVLQKALILAAHKIKFAGKRIPKVLIPLDGETLLEKNIKILNSFGVNEIIVGVDKETEKEIKKTITGKTRENIKFFYVDASQGTGAALRAAKRYLNKTFLMMNGDIYLRNMNLEDMYFFHKALRVKGTIAVATAIEPAALGTIHVKGNFITDFMEKAADKEKHSYLINGGVYILEPGAADFLPAGKSMVENDLFPILAKAKKLAGYPLGHKWVHLHDEKAYREFIKRYGI